MFRSLDEIKNELKLKKNIKFKVRVSANSSTGSIDFCDESIKIKVKAPAIEGKANKAVIEFLSDILDVPKSYVKIINGQKASIKTISVQL